LVMIAVILRRRLAPPTALAWLTIVAFVPVVGLVAYLLIGDAWLGQRRAQMHQQTIERLREQDREHRDPDQQHRGQPAYRTRPDVDADKMPLVREAEKVCGLPILAGNHVEFLEDTQPTVDRLVADIDAAEHHVHLLFYIYEPDAVGTRVTAALERAVSRGVAVRLMADAAGSRSLFAYTGPAAAMREAGIEVVPALPVKPFRRRLARMDIRNHRKLAVIDGRTAYTGSHNIVEAHYHKRAGQWVDLNARLTGPVVRQMQMVFAEDWAYETQTDLEGPSIFPELEPAGDVLAQTVPTGPGEITDAFQRIVLSAINAARDHLMLTTPYFVPDEATMLSLMMAADRGAKVELVLPRHSDHPLVSAAGRASFERLLENGIHIYEFHEGLLHAKTLSVDDDFAMLGSGNMDIRSFSLNFEMSILL
ncbi:MAG: cardiolipin synthase, partial [Phycisphaeraceae bacterium]|nr:cardiolipin synthase [Phycisphaeraceae bacterium]